TIIRLVEQGHKVQVAYMTSGNIAVFDHDAWRFTDFVVEFNRLFAIDQEHTEAVRDRAQAFLRGKKPGQPDSEELLKIKKLIREQGQHFEVWLYRGAWEEWEPHEIERVVPLSPEDLERKKLAIFRHQSQKDRAMFPGVTDRREFWQRAEDRNRDTAKLYDTLGLPEFYALEGFVQWRDGAGG